ncbi:MAG: PA2169 family four-helix-bundle protein [Bryobacteraceae bacterium]
MNIEGEQIYDQEETVTSLNELIEICRNAEYGFRTASEHVRNSQLATIFEEYASKRSGFSRALQAEVERLGGTPVDSGTVTGALHRGWIDLKSAFSGGDVGAIVAACETGEQSAVAAYERVAEYTNLTGDARTLVEKQFKSVQEVHNRMVRLQDEIKNGAEYPRTE